MAMDMAGVPDMNEMPSPTYPGSVMDTEGTPIEHIKVTIEWQGAFPVKDIKYTDSNGMFYLDIINAPDLRRYRRGGERRLVRNLDRHDHPVRRP